MHRKWFPYILSAILMFLFIGCTPDIALEPATASPTPASEGKSPIPPTPTMTNTPGSTPHPTSTTNADWEATLQAGQTQNALHQATLDTRGTELSRASATVLALTPTITPTPKPTATPAGGEVGKIAYSACASNNFINCEIFVMNTDGSHPIQLTDNDSADTSPAWSPDGTKIAFESWHDGNADIYVMNADGSDQIRLTDSKADDTSPTWSPDSAKIAFISDHEVSGGIYIVNADGSDSEQLMSSDDYILDLSWSPDGKKFALTVSTSVSSDEIFIMNTDGTNLTRLLDVPIETQNLEPAWSPDSTQVAFQVYQGDGTFRIYVVNVNSRSVIALRDGWSPAWSPDGSQILYGACKDNSNTQCGIFVMYADGGSPAQLTDHPPGFSGFTWLSVQAQSQPVQLPDCSSGWTRLEAGGFAKVSEESASPNRVRSEPNTAAEVIALIHPGTEVKLIEGPVCADGLIFWRVQSEIIPGGEGWTAEGDGVAYWLEPYQP